MATAHEIDLKQAVQSIRGCSVQIVAPVRGVPTASLKVKIALLQNKLFSPSGAASTVGIGEARRAARSAL